MFVYQPPGVSLDPVCQDDLFEAIRARHTILLAQSSFLNEPHPRDKRLSQYSLTSHPLDVAGKKVSGRQRMDRNDVLFFIFKFTTCRQGRTKVIETFLNLPYAFSENELSEKLRQR